MSCHLVRGIHAGMRGLFSDCSSPILLRSLAPLSHISHSKLVRYAEIYAALLNSDRLFTPPLVIFYY